MPVVNGTIERPGSTARKNVEIRIQLVASTTDSNAPGYVAASDVETFGPKYLRTDETGKWTITLRPNSAYIPSGTVYKIREKSPLGFYTYYIEVPNGAGPYWVGDILTDPPATMASSALSAHLSDTTDAHDASAISFTPAGTIAATTVQGAIEEVASEGGSAGLSLGSQQDTFYSGSVVVAADGTSGPIAYAFSGTKPAWINGSGQIITAGLYSVYASFSFSSGWTDATKRTKITMPFAAIDTFTPPASAGFFNKTLLDVGAIGDTDLPLSISPQISTEADATGAWASSLFIVRNVIG